MCLWYANTLIYSQKSYRECHPIGRGGSKGGLGGLQPPLLLVHQWKYGEDEGEEEVEERRKNGEMVEEEEISPPFDSVLHPPLPIGT